MVAIPEGGRSGYRIDLIYGIVNDVDLQVLISDNILGNYQAQSGLAAE